VKDPFRTAHAVRNLALDSRLRVIHMGGAHSPDWAQRAKAEMARNPRYHWLGEVPGWRVRREFTKTHLMVLSSLMEGGANVTSEALVAGVPVIASRIDGNVGLLGDDYPGYFPPGDTNCLRALLDRAENDKGFLEQLAREGAKRKSWFTAEHESAHWRQVISELTAG
jgi:glycosyltransferase involved in cell wall biosynthesis